MSNVQIFFAGDFCSKPSTSKITVSEELRSLIQSCDLKVVNFEVPLKPENVHLPAQKRERFFQHDDTPDFLRGLGFNLFQLANNHTFDWGEEGFKKTKAALGDESFGAGSYEEAYKVKIVEKNGFKIGFMSLSFAAYTGVFDDVTNHEGLGCAYINDLRVNHDIIRAKEKVDYLFVLPHDGIEYIDIPMPETIARYRDFIDYGADGVIGTHPHCPQGWEVYKDKPIFYSLGNFLFNSKEGYDYRAWNRPHWYEGLCVIMNLSKENLSWQIINTRNINNVEISIDNNEERIVHNNVLCSYLYDEDLYNNYLLSISEDHSNKDIRRIKRMFIPKNIQEAIKAVWASLRGVKPQSKEELRYLLKNDLKRSRLARTIFNL
jgi:poly-gamma-glutamate synthesis protein (capsule biosynthesis protein)